MIEYFGMNELKNWFEEERNIPYRIPLAVSEADHCCSGKHERLRKRFETAGYPVHYRICWFRWSDLALPVDVANITHEDECSHVYLEVKVGGQWKVVDATWDPGLASIFSINEWSDNAEMQVAVPVIRSLSPEESEKHMTALTPKDTEEDLEKHREFYRALNGWFEAVRGTAK